MNKGKKSYVIIWALLVVLFNFLCFIIPSKIARISKFTPAFWTAYGFISAAFVIHLGFTLLLKNDDKEMKVPNTFIAVISWIELAIMVTVGTIAMVVPGIPYWVGAIVCAVILIVSIIFLIFAKNVGENTVKANIELNIRTKHMRQMTDKAETLLRKAKSDESKTIIKSVYEAFRFSDLTSNAALQKDEDEIHNKLDYFIRCVSEQNEMAEAKRTADELIDLIEARNRKCKEFKHQV